MDNEKGGKSCERTLSREDRVKPEGSGARADLSVMVHNAESPMFGERLMEAICERGNLEKALKRVISNKGGAGVDGMNVKELREHLKENWVSIKAELIEGRYKPEPVKRVEIPKPKGGTRKLGVPTVLDRFIQQAMLQILQAKWDKTFSDNSYGFRPKRSAHQAIAKAQAIIREGNSYVVDIDLEKFFDRVCHDRLMSRLAQRIKDPRVLKLLRAYLEAGVFEDGLVSATTEGTPQGGPLSPFLSNVVLDELDKELEARGHCFVRYADDCNIYVKTERAGHRVMAGITRFIEKRLRLKVNTSKSAVDKPRNRSFLGFTFATVKEPHVRKISSESLKRFKVRVRKLTRRNSGRSLQEVIKCLAKYLTGWIGYFGYCETPSVLKKLDEWVRTRLRCYQWKLWKRPYNRKQELMKLGVFETTAGKASCGNKGPWRMSHSPGIKIGLNNNYFISQGLPCLAR